MDNACYRIASQLNTLDEVPFHPASLHPLTLMEKGCASHSSNIRGQNAFLFTPSSNFQLSHVHASPFQPQYPEALVQYLKFSNVTYHYGIDFDLVRSGWTGTFWAPKDTPCFSYLTRSGGRQSVKLVQRNHV